MTIASFRPLFAAAALAMALLGALSVALFGGSQTPASAYDTYTVEVNEEGFNPRTCQINRGDSVVFKNAGNAAIRVYIPGFGGLPPSFDQTLEPGETSASPLRFDAGGNYLYYSEFGDFVTISTPKTANAGQVNCSKEAPTPTPTPTATPGPPPTPTPVRPSNCTWVGCAVSLGVASDGN
jgi:plastocyanin